MRLAPTRSRILALGGLLTLLVAASLLWIRTETRTAGSAAPRAASARGAAVEERTLDAGDEPTRRRRASPSVDAAPSTDDVTLLRVRVLGPERTSVTSGWIDYMASIGADVEFDVDSRAGTRAVRDEWTEIELPASDAEVLVTASAPGLAPRRVRASSLRQVEGSYVARGLVVRELEIVLDAEDPGACLVGRVRVDGAARMPDGLDVRLVRSSEDRDGASSESALRAMAVLDRTRCTYAITCGAGGLDGALWVTSAATVPAWVPVPRVRPGDAATLDLELSSGRALDVDVLDARTGAPVDGLALLLDAQVPTARDGERVAYRVQFKRARTDALGRCTFDGLPSIGAVALRVGPDPSEPASGMVLLQRALVADDPPRIHEVVRIERTARAVANVWGVLRDWPATGPAPSVRFRRFDDPPERAAGRGRLDEQRRWDATVAAPGKYAFWLEEQGGRASADVVVHVERAEPVGPVELTPTPAIHARVEWRDAPSGWTLRLEHEGSTEALFSTSLDGSDGARDVALRGTSSVCAALVSPDGCRVERRFAWDPAVTPVLELALCGSSTTAFALAPDTEGVRASGVLVAWALDASGKPAMRTTLRAPLSGARMRTAAPLPAGTYFIRFDAPAARARICGIARVSSAHAGAQQEIAWTPMRVDPSWSAGGARGLEAVECDGLDLRAQVPAALRRMPFESVTDAAGGAEPAAAPVLGSAGCRFVPYP